MTDVFPQGWVIKTIFAGETRHILLPTGISNIYIFFITRKKNVVAYSHIHDMFASTNLT